MLFLFLSLAVVNPSADRGELDLTSTESWALGFPTHHVQGLYVSDDYFWITGVDRLGRKGWIHRYDRKIGRVAASRDLTLGNQYHPGGIDMRGENLWVPMAEYRPKSSATLLRLDPLTLETRAAIPLEDHLGGVAAYPDGSVVAANWDCRLLYVLPAGSGPPRAVPNPGGVAYQDLKYAGDRLWGVGSEGRGADARGIVDLLDPITFARQKRYRLTGRCADGSPNFGREGMAVHAGSLYLLPEDGPASAVHRFPLPEAQ